MLYGKVALSYVFKDGEIETFKPGVYLGMTIGEEYMHAKKQTYKENAVVDSSWACMIRISKDTLKSLADESFQSYGMGSQSLRKDMDIMFEQMQHVHNWKS